MKKMLKFVLSLTLVVSAAFLTTGAGPYPPTADKLQSHSSVFGFEEKPPAKICKDDTVSIILSYRQEYSDEPVQVGAATLAGTLSESLWSFPAGDDLFAIFQTTLTAKKIGKGSVDFVVSLPDDSGGGVTSATFEVIECDYDLRLLAYEKRETDVATYNIFIDGKGHILSQDTVSGEGMYDMTFWGELQDEVLKSGSKGLGCTLEHGTAGSGSFDVTGNKNKDTLTVDIHFNETEFGEGVLFHCIDESGSEGVIPIFENTTVNPGDSINLTNLKFSKNVTQHKFQFGESGSGFVNVLKRSKK
jgi:hypothetical protein